MLKRHEVEILLKAGHAKTEVARLSGVSLRSVKRIADERPVEHVDDARERVQRQIGRPSTVTNFRKQVVEIVRETPDLASLEILRRVKESGYSGRGAVVERFEELFDRCRLLRHFQNRSIVPLHQIGHTQVFSTD